MAKISLTQENVESLNRAFEFYFENGRVRDGEYVAGNLKWEDLNSFLQDITDTSGIDAEANYKSAKVAVDAINNIFIEGSKPESEKMESERPTTEQLETLEKEASEAKAKYQETIENAKKNVEAAIKKQEEIHAKLAANQKKIYAKVEASRTRQIEAEKLQKLEGLREQAKIDPKKLMEDLGIERQVKNQLMSTFKDQLTENEIDIIAKKTALDTVKGLANPNAQARANVQAAILNKLSSDKRVVPKVVGKESLEAFRQAAKELGFFANGSELSRGIVKAIDEDLALVAFGDPEGLRVELFNRTVRGFTNTISPDQLSAGYTNLLQKQSAFFDNLGGVVHGEAKRYLFEQARTWLDGQVAKMSPEIVGVYQNAFVQDALRYIGLGKPVAFGETGIGGVLLKIPGASPFFEGLGKTLGIDFIGNAGKAATTAAVEASTTVGAETVAAGVGVAAGAEVGAGAGVAAGAAVGQTAIPIPGVGAAIGAFLGFVAGALGTTALSWLSDKYQKNKEMIIAIPVAGIVTVFAGPLAGFASGLGTYGIASYLGGGFPPAVSGFLSNTVAFFKGLTGVFLGEIAIPIISILLGVPVVIAFILFIINSGAYVVPPSIPLLVGQNEFIDVKKTASPPGPFQNTELPLKITYTITVSAKKVALTNVSIKDECSAVSQQGSQPCGSPSITVPGGSISVGAPFTFTYDDTYGPSFKDSFVIDTVTVSAKVVGESSPQVANAVSSVKIGEPPEECPSDSIWPTGTGRITQGAYTTSTHSSLEALDIGVSHVAVMTTHSGVVIRAQSDSCYGNNVEIKSSCAGKEFVSRYAHLEGIGVKKGQVVTTGQQIGLSGNTTGGKPSCSTGAHLHYDFHYWPVWVSTKYPNNPPFMMPPYTPKEVKRGCVSNCFVSW